MSPKQDALTPEQEEAVAALQKEISDLELQADEVWSKYVQTGSLECFNTVQGIDSEIEMKGLIAYIPKAGEGKISRIRGLVAKVKNLAGEECEDCDPVLPEISEARLQALTSVNEWREHYGLKPLDRLPVGVVGDTDRCVMAKALKMGWEDLPDYRGVTAHVGGDESEFTLTYTKTVSEQEYNDYSLSYIVPEWCKDEIVDAGQDDLGYFFTLRSEVEHHASGMSWWRPLYSGFDSLRYPDLVEDIGNMIWATYGKVRDYSTTYYEGTVTEAVQAAFANALRTDVSSESEHPARQARVVMALLHSAFKRGLIEDVCRPDDRPAGQVFDPEERSKLLVNLEFAARTGYSYEREDGEVRCLPGLSASYEDGVWTLTARKLGYSEDKGHHPDPDGDFVIATVSVEDTQKASDLHREEMNFLKATA